MRHTTSGATDGWGVVGNREAEMTVTSSGTTGSGNSRGGTRTLDPGIMSAGGPHHNQRLTSRRAARRGTKLRRAAGTVLRPMLRSPRFEYWRRHVAIPENPAECWEWTATRNRFGYGQFFYNGSMRGAHRFAYEAFVGPLPAGKAQQLDHLCRNRACVNPGHLELVTARTNNLRGEGWAAIHARKTRCIRGHPLVEGNIKWYGRKRNCRTCEWLRRRSVAAGFYSDQGAFDLGGAA